MDKKKTGFYRVAPGTHSRILASQEGRILLAGLLLTLLYLAGIGVVCLQAPATGRICAAMTMTHVMFGRAAGLSFGYAAEAQDSIVVFVNMAVETLLVLLFYPLFVFSWRKLVEIPALGNFMERTNHAAETHRPVLKKYGVVGLFLFVWFPFWMTGPLVGCAIGFLIGLTFWVNMTVVLGGTYLAIVSWAFLLRELHRRLIGFNPYAPMVFVALIIVVIIIINAVQRRRKNSLPKK